MEQLQQLDDEIVDRIIESSLLDLSDPGNLSAVEVHAAAGLAVQMMTRRRSPPAPDPVSEGRSPCIRDQPPAQDIPPSGHDLHRQGQGVSSITTQLRGIATHARVIRADQRKEILADSEASDDPDTGNEGEPCIVCGGGSGEKRQLSCRCYYCGPCLRRCIRTGLRNEGDFPPKCCCQRLTEDDIRWTGRPDLLQLYEQAAREWDSPVAERVYCARPECRAFIAERQGDEARCGECGERTCVGCRQRTHPGLPCREDEEEERLMDMMDEYGWASCNRCRRIVELQYGCNHITCGCGHQFCYLCGADWRTCQCPMYGTTGVRRAARDRRQRYRQGHRDVPMRPQRNDGGLIFIDHGDQPRIPGNRYVMPEELGMVPNPQGDGRHMWPMPEEPAPALPPGNGGLYARAVDAGGRGPPRGGNLVFLAPSSSSDEDHARHSGSGRTRARSRHRRRTARREGTSMEAGEASGPSPRSTPSPIPSSGPQHSNTPTQPTHQTIDPRHSGPDTRHIPSARSERPAPLSLRHFHPAPENWQSPERSAPDRMDGQEMLDDEVDSLEQEQFSLALARRYDHRDVHNSTDMIFHLELEASPSGTPDPSNEPSFRVSPSSGAIHAQAQARAQAQVQARARAQAQAQAQYRSYRLHRFRLPPSQPRHSPSREALQRELREFSQRLCLDKLAK